MNLPLAKHRKNILNSLNQNVCLFQLETKHTWFAGGLGSGLAVLCDTGEIVVSLVFVVGPLVCDVGSAVVPLIILLVLLSVSESFSLST